MHACVLIVKFLTAENVSCGSEKLLLALSNFFRQILRLPLRAGLVALQQICGQRSTKLMTSSFWRTYWVKNDVSLEKQPMCPLETSRHAAGSRHARARTGADEAAELEWGGGSYWVASLHAPAGLRSHGEL